MLIKATQKYTRQSPRKVRLVANTVKKLPLEQALKQLAVIERRATLVVMKVVKQAMANAINNHGLKFEDLVLDSILVTPGPTYRRMRAVSRGRGHEIKKRTSHVTVVLSTREAGKKEEKKTEKVVAKPEVKAEEVKPATKKRASTKKVSKKVTK